MGIEVPFRPLPWMAPDIAIERRSDGSILMWSKHAPGIAPLSIAHLLYDRAAAHPDRPFIRQRPLPGAPWHTLTYGDAQRGAEAIAQFLLDRGMTADDSVMILSGNSIDHALIMLGCYAAGVPVAPVSQAMSLASSDHAKLKNCAAVLKPRIIFAESGNVFSAALDALNALCSAPTCVTSDGHGTSLSLATLLATEVDANTIREARARLSHRSIAKYLFTSGSTGTPKAVPQTHGMMAAMVAALDGLVDGGQRADPEFVPETLEWMPWSHVSAGNVGFNDVLSSGGTLYLDAGKPVPGLFETTIENLRDVAPVTIGSAPIAFGMLADALECDADFRARFFSNLRYMTYGGATMSDDVYRRLQALAIAETGHRVPLLTMYGATETQGITMTHWITERAGLVGLPMPGMVIKLVPNGAKLEIRVTGPTVTTGYIDSSGSTEWPFDEEGFYKLGDAVRFIDGREPDQGLIFDGRVAEDFKLDSGTWVSVGILRPAIVTSCSPLIQDAVIVGHDRPFVGALLWPSSTALTRFPALADGQPNDDLVAAIRDCLIDHNRGKGSAQRIARFILLDTPPSLDDGEITEKGNVNQRTAIARRSDTAALIYRDPPPTAVVVI